MKLDEYHAYGTMSTNTEQIKENSHTWKIKAEKYQSALEKIAADIPAARQNTPVSYLQGIAKAALEI